ncbi:hypothetical protein ACC715_36840, partial [Rhizobium ruizarguesonis]
GAKKVTMEEFKSFADVKHVKVEIFDLEKPLTADLVWSWKKGTITVKANVDGKMIDVKIKLTFKDGNLGSERSPSTVLLLK